MKITLLFFGKWKDISGQRLQVINLPDGLSVREFRMIIMKEYPEWPMATHYAIAVNLEYAGEDHVIKDGDEVALIPPVSGG